MISHQSVGGFFVRAKPSKSILYLALFEALVLLEHVQGLLGKHDMVLI